MVENKLLKVLLGCFLLVFFGFLLFSNIVFAMKEESNKPPSSQDQNSNISIGLENPVNIFDKDGNKIVNPTAEDVIWVVIEKMREYGILIAIGVIVWGGFKFIIAKGEASKVTAARKLMLYAVIGVAVLIGAEIIIKAVLDLLGAQNTTVGGEPVAGQAQTIYDKFALLLKYFYTIILSLSIVYLAKSGLTYIRSGSDPSKVADIKKSAIYGLVGITFVVFVWVIIQIIAIVFLKDLDPTIVDKLNYPW